MSLENKPFLMAFGHSKMKRKWRNFDLPSSWECDSALCLSAIYNLIKSSWKMRFRAFVLGDFEILIVFKIFKMQRRDESWRGEWMDHAERETVGTRKPRTVGAKTAEYFTQSTERTRLA